MKKSILVLAALAAIVSCSKENNPTDNYTAETFTVELTASAPSVNKGNGAAPASAMTKTTLVDGQNSKLVHWSKGDAIKVLFFPKHTIYAGFSGSNGVFTSYFDEDASASAYFRCDSWSWGSTVSQNGVSYSLNEKGIALYPATATAKSTKPSGTSVICDTEVSFVLPSTQTAVKDNIESNLNFSYATVELSKFQSTISNGAQTDLKFNNACAMIELTMPSSLDKKVTSISIVSNNDIPLTGKGTATMSYYKNEIDSNPNVNDGADHIFKPILSEGAGVTLNNANGFEAGAKYYVVVWPGKHDGGLTIEFAAEDGTKATKTTPAVELTASKVKPYTFNKGLVFESSTYDYVYSDGTFGNEVKSNIIGVVIYNGAPQDIDSGIPSKFSTGVAVYVDQYKTKWQTSKSMTTPSLEDAGVKLANSASKSSVGGYTAKVNLLALNSSYLALYNGMPSFSYSFTTELYVGTTKEWDLIAKDMTRINDLLSAAGKTKISGDHWTANASSINYSYYTSGNGIYKAENPTWDLNSRPIFAF